jgi:hypothetical protein
MSETQTHSGPPELPPSGQPVFEVTPGTNRHWLVLPETIRGLWVVAFLVLAGTVALEFVVDYHLKFGKDAYPAFGALLGLVSCALLVGAAKVLAIFLKRREDYYHD